MGNKKRLKPGSNALMRRTNMLMVEIERIKRLNDYTHRLMNEYIVFKDDIKGFQQFLKEKNNAVNKENRELQESSGGNRDPEEKEQRTKDNNSNAKESTTIPDIPKQYTESEKSPESGDIGV